MRTQVPVVAVTGASGYLGSQVCTTLESEGWQVIRLARSPDRSHGQACSYDLACHSPRKQWKHSSQRMP